MPADVWSDPKFGVIVADPPWSFRNFRESEHGAARFHYDLSSLEEIKAVPVASWAAEDCVLALWCTWPKLDEGMEVLRAWGFRYVTAIPWIKTVPEVVEVEIQHLDKEDHKALDESSLGEGMLLRHLCIRAGTKTRSVYRRVLARVRNSVRRGIGYWTQSASEVLLIARRGEPRRLAGREQTPIGLLHEEERVFWHPIGKHSQKPEGIQDWLEKSFAGPFLELYATRNRPGWTCWGFNTGWRLSEEGVTPFTSTTVSKSGHLLDRGQEKGTINKAA